MVEMVNIVPLAACPNCGHRQFVVFESQMSSYLTDRDGDIISTGELSYSAEGVCCRCGSIVKMMPIRTGFIPMTRLREILFDYTPHAAMIKDESIESISNPMEVSK